MTVRVTAAADTDTDLDQLAGVAATTFPLACPPSARPDDIAAFIAANLSRERFAEYLSDPERVVLAARDGERILGYAISIRGVGDDDDVARSVTLRPAVELSKMHVLADRHGAGVAARLIDAAISRATDSGARCVWLGVNQNNQRAQRFYGKHGFTTVGARTFQLGAHLENDFVMVRPLT